jgi:predicted alpha/beta superfamily hydrolase
MKSIYLSALFLILSFSGRSQATPKVISGNLLRWANFPSQFVTARNIDVWLPENYDPRKKYAVLYMHDGQMLFDSSTTWNKQSWNVDDVLAPLLANHTLNDLIVVGVWNGGPTRHMDYFPQKPFESLSLEQQQAIFEATRSNGASVFNKNMLRSDGYLKFLTQELKPFIDQKFATYPDRAHTFVAGSSMGGLISMYAICEYPDIFGGAACFSTHWPGIFTLENNPIPDAFLKYLSEHLPDPASHLIYFDYGTATLDALYPAIQKKADAIMRQKGFTSENWITRAYPGEPHSEVAWNKRFHIPMLFLLKRT